MGTSKALHQSSLCMIRGRTSMIRMCALMGTSEDWDQIFTLHDRQDTYLFVWLCWNKSCGFFWDRGDHHRYARQDTHLYEWMRWYGSWGLSILFHKKPHSAHLGSTVTIACRFSQDSAHKEICEGLPRKRWSILQLPPPTVACMSGYYPHELCVEQACTHHEHECASALDMSLNLWRIAYMPHDLSAKHACEASRPWECSSIAQKPPPTTASAASTCTRRLRWSGTPRPWGPLRRRLLLKALKHANRRVRCRKGGSQREPNAPYHYTRREVER